MARALLRRSSARERMESRAEALAWEGNLSERFDEIVLAASKASEKRSEVVSTSKAAVHSSPWLNALALPKALRCGQALCQSSKRELRLNTSLLPFKSFLRCNLRHLS